METWYIVLLAVVALIAVAILLFFSLIGDDAIRLHKKKHRRGDYINDQTAVIYQTIKNTADDAVAYQLFVEYLFANNKHFLAFLSRHMREMVVAFLAGDCDVIREQIKAVHNMKIELKDQKTTQDDCMKTIDPKFYIENEAWIHISNNCRFDINECLGHIADDCLRYSHYSKEPLSDSYREMINAIVDNIDDICRESTELIGSGNIMAMRELRRKCSIILSESQDKTQRIYDVLNDGRSEISENRRTALKYVLNNMRECHCIIYTLRRLVLCNIGKTLSVKNYSRDKKSGCPTNNA